VSELHAEGSIVNKRGRGENIVPPADTIVESEDVEALAGTTRIIRTREPGDEVNGSPAATLPAQVATKEMDLV
jgi:hypothetical protein